MLDANLRLAAWNSNFQRLLDVPDSFLVARPHLDDYIRLLVERREVGEGNVEAEIARYRQRAGTPWSSERTAAPRSEKTPGPSPTSAPDRRGSHKTAPSSLADGTNRRDPIDCASWPPTAERWRSTAVRSGSRSFPPKSHRPSNLSRVALRAALTRVSVARATVTAHLSGAAGPRARRQTASVPG